VEKVKGGIRAGQKPGKEAHLLNRSGWRRRMVNRDGNAPQRDVATDLTDEAARERTNGPSAYSDAGLNTA
jgi:hypothetical protein